MDGFKVYVEAINIFSHNNTTIPVTKISRRRGGGGGGGNSIAPTLGVIVSVSGITIILKIN